VIHVGHKFHRGFPLNPMGECPAMARELVWLENSTFAAWGCSACYWLVANPKATVSKDPPAEVKAAFNNHDCATNPRFMRRKPGASKG